MIECFQRLQLAFGDESPCCATIFRLFKEFRRSHTYLQEEEHSEGLRLTVIPDCVSTIRKILMSQESKVWILEDNPMPTMVKRQRATKKVMFALFFRSTELVKAIKLFFNPKKNLRGHRFHSEEETDAAINGIFHQF
ncbi:UNVERIFIED_CONTAM: hypothetical protein NCL1_36284 [Trichonephila clavipes]